MRCITTLAGGFAEAFIYKLVIESQSDYPLGRPFPPRLESLDIRNINLRRFDNRILRLTNLSALSIEASRISSVPKDVECLRLTLLCLKSNLIETWPSVSKGSALAISLRYLNLSGNRIAWLPDDFWNLENLESLLITDNHLAALPAANLQRLKKLRDLHLQNNRLRCLPYALSQFRRMGMLSLSGNPWVKPFPPVERNEAPKSLFHFASAVVLRNYGHLLHALVLQLPRNVEMQLSVLRRCFRCGRVCGAEADWYVGYIELDYTERIYSPLLGVRSEVKPVCIRYYCSPHCGIRGRMYEHFH
ncbi:unnamed protein product [Hydatigera taeniaeformis]|uniref:Leucine-rich repeat protein 1 n=1 Tax=Hydatigena taeniaeformis TaxID=6205 RepID=A0A0R3WLF4_HYDTA|nr:unnamed protein product [Hydatigera taeniaeformis]